MATAHICDDGNAALSVQQPSIASFAVLDLETTNLPAHNFNKVAITELCVYGVALQQICKSTTKQQTKTSEISETVTPRESETVPETPLVPETPRVLHKLTLLLNPRMMVHPDSEAITGLNNYMLEYESGFDENAANTLMGFLGHLQQPVCLVAHNGWSFDFPIVKQALDKLRKILPSETLCLDSLRAFHDIDKLRSVNALTAQQESVKSSSTDAFLSNALADNSLINWRAFNETTPKRPTKVNATEINAKRRRSEEVEIENTATKRAATESFKYRRSLFSTTTATASTVKHKKFYPPKGVYKLDNMYGRIFNCAPKQAHHAEADVSMLLKLIQHYGSDFVQYAEEHAYPFAEVQKVGA